MHRTHKMDGSTSHVGREIRAISFLACIITSHGKRSVGMPRLMDVPGDLVTWDWPRLSLPLLPLLPLLNSP